MQLRCMCSCLGAREKDQRKPFAHALWALLDIVWTLVFRCLVWFRCSGRTKVVCGRSCPGRGTGITRACFRTIVAIELYQADLAVSARSPIRRCVPWSPFVRVSAAPHRMRRLAKSLRPSFARKKRQKPQESETYGDSSPLPSSSSSPAKLENPSSDLLQQPSTPGGSVLVAPLQSPGGSTFEITVPEGVQPGERLKAVAPSGLKVVMVVPPGSTPGMRLTFTAPSDAVYHAEDGGIEALGLAPSPSTAAGAAPAATVNEVALDVTCAPPSSSTPASAAPTTAMVSSAEWKPAEPVSS